MKLIAKGKSNYLCLGQMICHISYELYHMSNEEIKNDFLKDIKTDDEWFERISKFHNETLTDFTISSQSIERDFKCVAMGTCGKNTNIYKNYYILSNTII